MKEVYTSIGSLSFAMERGAGRKKIANGPSSAGKQQCCPNI
jgi:hypothetical protein